MPSRSHSQSPAEQGLLAWGSSGRAPHFASSILLSCAGSRAATVLRAICSVNFSLTSFAVSCKGNEFSLSKPCWKRDPRGAWDRGSFYFPRWPLSCSLLPDSKGGPITPIPGGGGGGGWPPTPVQTAASGAPGGHRPITVMDAPLSSSAGFHLGANQLLPALAEEGMAMQPPFPGSVISIASLPGAACTVEATGQWAPPPFPVLTPRELRRGSTFPPHREQHVGVSRDAGES